MISQGRQIGSLFVLLFVLTACGQGGPGWGTFPVTLYGDPSLLSSTDAASDFNDAMTFWEKKSGKQLFDYRGQWSGSTPYTGNPTAPNEIAANVIFYQNPWPFGGNIVGQTTTVSSGAGQIQAGIIMINPDTSFCGGDCAGQYNRTSRRKAFTHELGHFIGLTHVQDPTNIMYPELMPGGSLNTVAIDDSTLKTLTNAQ